MLDRNWWGLISDMVTRTRSILINLFLSENPIGFVKSVDDLEVEVSRHFEILELVTTKRLHLVTLFARR